MKPDALLRLIRRVALKGALTDADVVVESQGGLVFVTTTSSSSRPTAATPPLLRWRVSEAPRFEPRMGPKYGTSSMAFEGCFDIS
jgi:hypothetical protein